MLDFLTSFQSFNQAIALQKKADELVRKIHEKKHASIFSIHTLVSHEDVDRYIISLYTFLSLLDFSPPLYVYDGGLIDQDVARIKQLPFVHICRLSSFASNNRWQKLSAISNVYKHRAKCEYIKKVFDVYCNEKKTEKTLILDSDVLFFRYPKELMQFLLGISTDSRKSQLTYMQDFESAYFADFSFLQQKYTGKISPNLNSGLIAFDSDLLSLKAIRSYFAVFEKIEYSLLRYNKLEQAFYAYLASSTESIALPSTYELTMNRKTKGCVCKHYVQPIRNFFMEDIKEIK
jgi:hypothetical protein